MEIEFTVVEHIRPNGDVPVFEAVKGFTVVSTDLKDFALAQVSKLQYKSKHSALIIKKVEKNLWYLDIKTNHKNIYARLFFTFLKNRHIVLLNGFINKTNKIPYKHLILARQLIKEVSYA